MEPPFSTQYPYLAAPRRRPFAWVTWTLVVTTVGIFVLQLVEFHRYRDDVVGDALGFSRLALAENRDWTLLTYAWVHAVAIVVCGVEVAQIIFQYVPSLARYSMPEVAHSAHLGGAAFGAFFTWLILPRTRREILAR